MGKGEPDHDRRENLDAVRKLWTRLGKWSPHNVLDRLDVHETFEVSCDIRRRRWGTETTRRDHMFLERLEMKVAVQSVNTFRGFRISFATWAAGS